MEVYSVRYLRTPANQLMLLSLSGPSNLLHGKGFGRVGLHSGASSSFGWLSTIDVGRQTDLLKVACSTRRLVLFVIRRKKPYSTSLWAVVTRQVWFSILQALHLPALVPSTSDTKFSSWWRKGLRLIPKDLQKGFNSLVILVAWETWKHRNSCVFEHARPSIPDLLRVIAGLWGLAGASKLQEFLARSLSLAT